MRRRWIFIAVVLVVSLAAVCVETVVMAVVGELRFHSSMSDQQPRSQTPDEDWVRRYSHSSIARGAMIDAELYVTSGDFTGGGFYAEVCVGWPIRSFQYVRSIGLISPSGVQRSAEDLPSAWRHGVEVPGWMRIALSPASNSFDEEFRRIPIRPIWPGLAVNTLLNACVIAPLMLLPGWVRRARRRAKGRCVRCGYSLVGLGAGAGCPECGGNSRSANTPQ
ncbi:MAG: hypothetical protein ACREJO_14830 [Phycisphaerales bacterium]